MPYSGLQVKQNCPRDVSGVVTLLTHTLLANVLDDA